MTAVSVQARVNRPRDLLRTLRPHQWVKSAFVFVGLIFSHRWNEPDLVMRVIATAAAFSLVASSMYVVNDISDVEKDRLHPTKRKRPIPAGEVTVGAAQIIGLLSLAAGLAIGTWASQRVLLILLLYLVLTVSYTYRLKHIVILDVFSIAAGFMLRIIAGTTGVYLAPSDWLLQCGLMITLFLGFAKRRAELIALAKDGAAQRNVLRHYSPVLLDKFIGITAATVIMSYSLYTMSPETIPTHGTEHLIYTVPFIVYGIFRYVYLLHNGSGDDPARDLFRDGQLLGAVVGWFAVTLFMLVR